MLTSPKYISTENNNLPLFDSVHLEVINFVLYNKTTRRNAQIHYLCLGYIAMVFYTYYFGIAGGSLVGTMGVLIYCFLTCGLWGMPGWMLGNLIIGVLCGMVSKHVRSFKNIWIRQ